MKILLKYWLLLLIISFSPAQILLNEIMIDAEDESSGEFIEIINCGQTAVRISDYFLCDPRDTDAVIPFPDSMLAPEEYGIILDPDHSGEYDDLTPDGTPRFSIEDSRFGMYGVSNSTAKCFAILDGDRKISDSYTTGNPQWPEETYTMERYMPDRDVWMQSLDPGGTPGARNSVSPKARDLVIGAVTCSCENDRMQVDILIRNCGLQQIAAFDYGYLIDTYGADNDLSDTLHYHTETLLQRGDSCRFSHSARIRNREAYGSGPFSPQGMISGIPWVLDIISPFFRMTLPSRNSSARSATASARSMWNSARRRNFPYSLRICGLRTRRDRSAWIPPISSIPIPCS
ncbi:MAG: hypothetical protein U5N26_00855 [Candidatus Marinimicrobia bacterium]|nr:hypothetical protein [Candidatus Neomarinimicrobiota bacterium]